MSTETAETRSPEGAPPRRVRRRRTRRPVRRLLVLTHRWLALVLGLVLLVITMSGAVLLYRPEIQRALNHDAYAASGRPATIGLADARRIVLAAHPRFPGTSVWAEHGVDRVTDGTTSWTVDPGTGRILGHVGQTPAFLRLLDNVHECLLSCEDYPGYVGLLGRDVPGTTWLGLDHTKVTYGGLVLGGFGVVLVYLSLTGIWLWFPRPGRWRGSMRVRWTRGRFARDTDLHEVVGTIAIPMLLVWAITGASYQLGIVEKAYDAATPGTPRAEVEAVSATPPKGVRQPDVGIDRAVAAAQALHPDATLVNVDLPAEDDPTAAYTMYFSRGFDPWAHSEYPGEHGVFVDRHTGVARDYYGFEGAPTSQVLWEDFNYPVHSGYIVNGWWRLLWLVVALAPLLLAVTGLSTWLVRRRSRRDRRAASRA